MDFKLITKPDHPLATGEQSYIKGLCISNQYAVSSHCKPGGGSTYFRPCLQVPVYSYVAMGIPIFQQCVFAVYQVP